MNASPTLPDHAGQPNPRLAASVELARAAAQVDAAEVTPVAVEVDGGGVSAGARDEVVGAHVAVHAEGADIATHLFEANYPGYRGWRWAVTVTTAGDDYPVTVSEVVLLPGPDALTAPEWVPWEQRIRAGDLGVGDLLPTPAEDPRLVPGYLESDDPAVEAVARELGLGRSRVLSRDGRLEAAQRWREERGPQADMALSAPGSCGTCGFYLPLAGSLAAAFGVCGNEYSPADGRAVHTEFGCGAHSETEVEPMPLTPVAEVVYDDSRLDLVEPRPPDASEVLDVPAPAEPSDG